MWKLYKDFIHFIIVAAVMATFFVFTNCGEEGLVIESEFDSENFVYLSYRDGDGQRQMKKAYFEEADSDLYIDGDVLIGSSQSISIGQEIELNSAVPDIMIEKSEGLKNLQALKSNKAKIWKDGKVPFNIGLTVSLENERLFLDIIFDLNNLFKENDVNLEFVRKTTERDYLEIVEMDLNFPMGGQSYVGRQGGLQELKIRTDNFNQTIIHHEVLHALGFKHEHQRSDRELHIYLENVNSNLKYNFSKYVAGSSIGEYDYKSIMHYHSYAFSNNGDVTMTAIDGSIIPRNRKLSTGDVQAVGAIYGFRSPVLDGNYWYSGRYFKVEDSYYCEYRTKQRHLDFLLLSLPSVATMRAQGLHSQLLEPPYCN